MGDKLISSVSDVDLTWLQSILDRRYPEKACTLSGYTIIESASMTSGTALIELFYKDAKDKIWPSSLFLKFCANNSQFIEGSEYFYYTRDYVGLENAPLPICYDAHYDKSGGAYHVLLQDLSRTHYTNKEIRPSLEHALAVATELARLHAFRWGRKSDSVLIGMNNSSSQISNFIAHVSCGLIPILNAIEKDTSDSFQATLREVFESYPTLMQRRAQDLSGQTLIHGDVNPSNVLSPYDNAGKTYIIDRQPFTWSLRFWLGVSDLAYMIVPYWDTEHRRNLEIPMLKKYHDSLTEFGVGDYSWQRCQEDYRLCISHGLYAAVEWGTNANDIVDMRWLWEKQLQRSMTAFADWDCKGLFLKPLVGPRPEQRLDRRSLT